MACMCGDTHCPSCGPAQGNARCPICRVWYDDGCEHVDENGIKPEFEKQFRVIACEEVLGDMVEYHKELLIEIQEMKVKLVDAEQLSQQCVREIKNKQIELERLRA